MTWLVLAAFVVALGLGWFALATSERLGREAHAVGDYQACMGSSSRGFTTSGPKPAGRRRRRIPGWTLAGDESVAASENDYSADGLVGWTLPGRAPLPCSPGVCSTVGDFFLPLPWS